MFPDKQLNSFQSRPVSQEVGITFTAPSVSPPVVKSQVHHWPSSSIPLAPPLLGLPLLADSGGENPHSKAAHSSSPRVGAHSLVSVSFEFLQQSLSGTRLGFLWKSDHIAWTPSLVPTVLTSAVSSNPCQGRRALRLSLHCKNKEDRELGLDNAER